MFLCPSRLRPSRFLVLAAAFLLAAFTAGCGVTGNPFGGSGVTLTPAQFAFPSQSVGTASAPAVFTLTNGQTAALSIAGIQVAAPFSQTNTCGASVAAGQTCTISVSFQPTAAGPASGALTITDSGSGSPRTAALSGTGAAAPVNTVTLSPATYTFPGQMLGTSSAAADFTLTNGSQALSISSIQIAAPFSETNTCGTGLAAGQSCTVSVIYTPVAAGAASATLTVNDDAAASPQTAAISGTGLPAGNSVTIAPAQFSFGNQAVGTTSGAAQFTLTNGSAPLLISSIQIAAPFAQTSTCATTLAPGQSCTVSVTYTPTALGASNASLTFTDDASGSPQSVAVSGTGVAAAGVLLSPGQFTFPDQPVGSTSAAANFTLTNAQATALTLSSIQITAPFAETNSCGVSLAPAQSCTIAVTYTPSALGFSTASLTVNDDAGGSPQSAIVNGNAVPAVSVVPVVGGLTFYQQLVNTTSTPLPVTITNNQSVPLTIASITSSPGFPVTSACGGVSGPGTLPPGASCVLSVSFLPQTAGPQTANLVVNEDAPGSPIVVPLAGTGLAGPGIAVIVSPNKPCALPSTTQQFNAAVSGTANTAVSWYVDTVLGGNATTGTITAGGLYTAPAASGSHLVSALSADPSGVSGNTTINVTSTPLFTIYPFSASIAPGAQQSFQPQICSQPDTAPVTYTVDNVAGGNATTGTVDAGGIYTAPAAPGIHTVAVHDPAVNKTSGALVTVFGNINADFGSRTNTTFPIPAGLFGYGRAESIQTTADRTLLTQAGMTYGRLYAQIPLVYATPTPDWTQIDPDIQSIKDAGQRVILQMAYTPPFLRPASGGCANEYATPTVLAAWGQLAATYVAHFDTAFPGLVQDYEIWNEPDAAGLCSPANTPLNDYLAIYAAAAPLMKQQAAADGATIRIGGPVLSGFLPDWITALTTTPSTAQYVDFVSYHQYLFGPTGLNAQWDSYNGVSSVYQATQDPDNGPAGLYNKVETLVKQGTQPGGAATPVYVTEFNINFAFAPDCCRNSAVYAPVWNALYVTDMLNNTYGTGTSPIANKLIYFAGSAYPYFCLIGVQDANSDCLYSEGAVPTPYPQYYTYQLLAAPNYLNLASGGYLAASVAPPTGGGGPVVTAFYEADQDAIVITNPTAANYAAVQVTAQNSGYTTAQATLYTITNGSTGTAITPTPLTVTSQGQDFTATVAIPPYSVQAISLKGQ